MPGIWSHRQSCWRIGWCGKSPPCLGSDVLWVDEKKGFIFQYARKEQIWERTPVPRAGTQTSLERVWLQSAGLWRGLLRNLKWNPWVGRTLSWDLSSGVWLRPLGAAHKRPAVCWRIAFWGARETRWGVSTIGTGGSLHAGCSSPQEQVDSKGMEPGREDPSSCVSL